MTLIVGIRSTGFREELVIQKRDKKGRFLPVGKVAKKRKPFNERYIKVGESIDDLDNAFLDGFERGRRLKVTISANEALKAWLVDNK